MHGSMWKHRFILLEKKGPRTAQAARGLRLIFAGAARAKPEEGHVAAVDYEPGLVVKAAVQIFEQVSSNLDRLTAGAAN